MLEAERNLFREKQPEWAAQYPNKVVLVKDDTLIGAYDSEDEALTVGTREYGLTPFLVRPVSLVSEEVNIPALTLGLLSANPTHTDNG